MRDIKQRGLLNPIGVWNKTGSNEYVIIHGNRRLLACKKLGWKTIPATVKVSDKLTTEDFLADNIAENIHRVDILPVEESRIYKWYREQGLSVAEISVLLSVPERRIAKLLNFGDIPEKYKDKIVNMSKGQQTKLGVPVSVANQIMARHYSKEQKELLFEEAKKNELTVQQLRVIDRLYNEGMSLTKAIKENDKWTTKNVEIVVEKKWADGQTGSFKDIVSKILVKDKEMSKHIFVKQ